MADPTSIAIFILAGALAGFMNVVAAGGSMLTLPVMIYFGLPADVANASNRVAILFQNVTASTTYLRRKDFRPKGIHLLIIPCMVGSLSGSFAVTLFDSDGVEKIIGYVLLIVTPLMLINFNKFFSGERKAIPSRLTILEYIAFFLVGFYGGFIQAGVGIFMLIACSGIAKFEIKFGNALKVILILFYTIPSMIWFQYNGLINWWVGINLAIGNMFGGWLGARASLKYGGNFIKYFFIGVMVLVSLKLTGLADWLIALI